MLNEAIAKEVGGNVRRREEVGSTAEELAAPQELKDVPIPPDSDPRNGRAMKAAIAVASSCEQLRAVAAHRWTATVQCLTSGRGERETNPAVRKRRTSEDE